MKWRYTFAKYPRNDSLRKLLFSSKTKSNLKALAWTATNNKRKHAELEPCRIKIMPKWQMLKIVHVFPGYGCSKNAGHQYWGEHMVKPSWEMAGMGIHRIVLCVVGRLLGELCDHCLLQRKCDFWIITSFMDNGNCSGKHWWEEMAFNCYLTPNSWVQKHNLMLENYQILNYLAGHK